MRMSLLAGVVVAIAAGLAVLVGASFGLDLEGYALIGVAMGAVVALVPDARPGFRLVGYLAGVGVSLVGYAARALVLPDSDGGRAFAAFAVLAACVAIASLSFGRLPLWSVFAGAAAFFGVYEAAFMAAPPEMATTAPTALTALLLTSALGYLAASFAAPAKAAETQPQAVPVAADRTADLDLERELAGLDDILEGTR